MVKDCRICSCNKRKVLLSLYRLYDYVSLSLKSVSKIYHPCVMARINLCINCILHLILAFNIENDNLLE